MISRCNSDIPKLPPDEVLTATGTIYTVGINRNDRVLQIEKLLPDATKATQLFKAYFPREPQLF